MIAQDRMIHNEVFKVNIDSSKKYQVINGKVMYDKENAKNRTPQADSPSAVYPNRLP